MGARAEFVWHKDTALPQLDAVIIPGGFSYGDYLRTGAIARFSPVMAAVTRFAEAGGLVLGICNGFQILLEAGLLPGAMLRNHSLSFICRDVRVRVENSATPFTGRCTPGQVVFRYCTTDGQVTPEANPNGSLDGIAGIANAAGNVLGLMPHPERSAEALLGNEDGRLILFSLLDALKTRKPVLAS